MSLLLLFNAAPASVTVVPGTIAVVGKIATVAVTSNVVVAVVPGAIAVVGHQPAVSVTMLVSVVPGSIAVVGSTPTAGATQLRLVDVVPGAIAVAGSTPTVVVTALVTVVPGVIAVVGKLPTVTITTLALVAVVPGAIRVLGSVPEAGPSIKITVIPGVMSVFGSVATVAVARPPLVLDGHLGKSMLVFAEPLTVGLEGSFDMDLFPPFGSPPEGWSELGTSRQTIYIAATTGRSTANDDVPPAQYVPGKLLPFNFGARLFEGLDPGQRSPNEGVISLIDPDGGLDNLINRIWDGTPITLKRGTRSTMFKDWPIVGRFRSSGLVRDLDQKQIQLRTVAWLLDGQLHDETYAGTGGVEGISDLTGRKKPWALGYNFQIEPILLSPSDQIFQWSKSSSVQLIELRHGGVSIVIDADYADYATLAAATIPSGKCATCLANSLVRPNLVLQFAIRVDVIGDGDTADGHGPPLTRAAIARRVVTTSGENRLDDATEIDDDAFVRMDTLHPAPVGWYFDGDFTKATALDRILVGVMGFWRVRPADGQLTIGWLEKPETQVPVATIAGGNDDVGKPRLVATAGPRRGTRVSFRWNWSPQPDRSSLAGAVSLDDAGLYARPCSYGQDLEPSIATTYPTGPLVTVDYSGYRDESDAVAEAAREQAVFRIVRNRWARDLQIDPFSDILGSPVRIANDPLNNDGTATQLVVAVEATGSSVVTLEFFA